MNLYLIKACKVVLTPIVRILLKNKVTYKAFIAIAKKVYVDVATEDYGLNGRPTNTNRVAILTGLDRKTIKQLKEQPDGALEVSGPMVSDRITRVLTGWHTDPDYLDEQQQPRTLNFADAPPNLETLLYRHGGDIQPTALLKELKRVDVVEEIEPNCWRATKRNYMQVAASPEILMRAFVAMGDLGRDVHHNLYVSDEATPKYFERRVTNSNIPSELVPEFRQFIDTEGQRFLELIDAWLNLHENSPLSNPEHNETHQQLRLGLGLYWIEHDEATMHSQSQATGDINATDNTKTLDVN